jgi:hypothetical protein
VKIEQKEVRVTAVLVSLMGAVHEKSLRDVQHVLECNDHGVGKFGY